MTVRAIAIEHLPIYYRYIRNDAFNAQITIPNHCSMGHNHLFGVTMLISAIRQLGGNSCDWAAAVTATIAAFTMIVTAVPSSSTVVLVTVLVIFLNVVRPCRIKECTTYQTTPYLEWEDKTSMDGSMVSGDCVVVSNVVHNITLKIFHRPTDPTIQHGTNATHSPIVCPFGRITSQNQSVCSSNPMASSMDGGGDCVEAVLLLLRKSPLSRHDDDDGLFACCCCCSNVPILATAKC